MVIALSTRDHFEMGFNLPIKYTKNEFCVAFA